MSQTICTDLQQMMNDLGWPSTCSINDCINNEEIRQSLLTFLYNKFFDLKEENVPDEYLNEWFCCLSLCKHNDMKFINGEMSFEKSIPFLHRLVTIVIDQIQIHNNNYNDLIKKNNDILRDIEMDYKNMLLPNENDYFPIDVKYSLKKHNKNSSEEDLKNTLKTIKEDINELEKHIKTEFESYYNIDTIEELGNELNKLLQEMNSYMIKYESVYEDKFNNKYLMNNNNNNNRIGDAVCRTVESSNGITTIISDMNEINNNLEMINQLDLSEYVRSKYMSEDIIEMNQRFIEILEKSKK